VRDFDPGRSAEEECGIRNSTRRGVRKRKAGSGARPGADCGEGMWEGGEELSRENESKSRSRIPLPRSAPGRNPGSRIPFPHSAPGRVPHPAFLFRTPHRPDLRTQYSSSELRTGTAAVTSPSQCGIASMRRAAPPRAARRRRAPRTGLERRALPSAAEYDASIRPRRSRPPHSIERRPLRGRTGVRQDRFDGAAFSKVRRPQAAPASSS
jgi:hypothetical protein